VLLPRLWITRIGQNPRGTLGALVGYLSILVGICGLIYHLGNAFFELQTLKSLVYTAPFAAPLSYVGLGLLLVLNRRSNDQGEEWARWVVFLAMGGFMGNIALSLADHAQNGFFSWAEWIPVVSASYASAFLLFALYSGQRAFLIASLWVQLAQGLVGISGFALHLAANLAHSQFPLRDRIIYGAPLFAPLLFVDLAALATIGLVRCLRLCNDSREPMRQPPSAASR
jgi:hypothetical protein